MKIFLSLIFLLGGLGTGLVAEARVPLVQMEKLRQQTVVVRVVLDAPDSKEAKSCPFGEDFATLGAALALKMDEATASWKNEKITSSDVALLESKIKVCASRGSCQIYERFLASATAEAALQPKLEGMKKNLDELLPRLEAADYRKAWASVPKPCEVFK